MNTDKRHRFELGALPDTISCAVWLYYRFNLSHRNVGDLLAKRGITVRRFTETLLALRGPNHALLDKLKDAGCLALTMSVQSISGINATQTTNLVQTADWKIMETSTWLGILSRYADASKQHLETPRMP